MKHFKFKFVYRSKSCEANGDGTISAETLDKATEDAQSCVANDFGGSPKSVAITIITEVKPKKSKK